MYVLYIQPLSQIPLRYRMEHHVFPDDSQLHRSVQPSDLDQNIFSVQYCVPDIKDRMTDKHQLTKDKTEATLFISSKLKDLPLPD